MRDFSNNFMIAAFFSLTLAPLVFIKVIPAVAAAPLQLIGKPLRVGGNVQASKLIHRVEPVYPELALQARISGNVVLQVTVDEEGRVADVGTISGHQLLREAAVDAVRQWRYSPTYLNDQPVPVIATVTIQFMMRDDAKLYLTMDAAGTLFDAENASGLIAPPYESRRLEGSRLMQRLSDAGAGPVMLNLNPSVPFPILEEILRTLQRAGVSVIRTTGPFVFRHGRLFYTRLFPQIEAPQVDPVSIHRWFQRVLQAGPSTSEPLQAIYWIDLDETGQVQAVERMGGPELPDVEAEIRQMRLPPARLESRPVPITFQLHLTATPPR